MWTWNQLNFRLFRANKKSIFTFIWRSSLTWTHLTNMQCTNHVQIARVKSFEQCGHYVVCAPGLIQFIKATPLLRAMPSTRRSNFIFVEGPLLRDIAISRRIAGRDCCSCVPSFFGLFLFFIFLKFKFKIYFFKNNFDFLLTMFQTVFHLF